MKLSALLYAAVGAAAFHAVMTQMQRSQQRADATGSGAGPAPTDPRDFSPPAGPAFGRSLEMDDPESAT